MLVFRSAPFGLTERELEVLGLLAAGLGNREIADRLFISPKTASVHVSNIYGKLGVESRVAAATVAHDLGLVAVTDEAEVPTRRMRPRLRSGLMASALLAPRLRGVNHAGRKP